MQLHEILVEQKSLAKQPKPLSFKLGDLSPIMSKETVDLHYNTLTKNYFKKYSKTHDQFQKAGAFLHDIWWENLTDQKTEPGEKTVKLIKNIDKFKENFTKKATTIKGNGWCALLKSGQIVQIHNHEIVKDIVLLVDVWEHAYIFDYKADKEKYVKSLWEIINWDIVESRL